MFKKSKTIAARAIEDPDLEGPEDPEGEETEDPVIEEPENNWGIADGYYLWPTVIKILIVIDGRIVLNKNGSSFGLGYVLDTMREKFAWWVSFEVDIARRVGRLEDAFELGNNQVKYQDFKFTDAGFNIDTYDQVWLFGDLPNADDGADGAANDADIPLYGLNDAEVKLLAEWMDRGGGVFATGDHRLLGASLSSRIPRVRTMRKWRDADGVPWRDNEKRNETLQPRIYIPSDPEIDQVMQPVELVYYPAPGPPPFSNAVTPHPLLCSTLGPIDRLPDHMHEGELFRDDEVALNRPLDIPNYDRPEYPSVTGSDGQTIRPTPHIIAYGLTTNHDVIADPFPTLVGGGTGTFGPKRFGLVSAYDGDPVNIGRVVVDSTWHHWLSMNLRPHAAFSVPLPRYQKLQAYYRNVALWLARPSQRQSMIVSATWGILTGSSPMEFTRGDNPWSIGERILGVFANTASPCIRRELADTVLGDTARLQSPAPAQQGEPVWSTLPVELTNRATFGGIGSGLINLALDHRDARAVGQRPPLNADAIREGAAKGMMIAQDLVANALTDAANAFTRTNARLQSRELLPVTNIPISIEVHPVRLVVTRLQLPNPDDPALFCDQLSFTIRVALNGSTIAQKTLREIELPSFGPRGAVLELGNVEIGQFYIHSGESLKVELFNGNPEPKDERKNLRFRHVAQIDRSNMIGEREPSRRQVWRLWYRVESSE